MRESPRDRTLVARVQTRAALDAILELEVYIPLLVQRVALGWTNPRRTLVGAR